MLCNNRYFYSIYIIFHAHLLLTYGLNIFYQHDNTHTEDLYHFNCRYIYILERKTSFVCYG